MYIVACLALFSSPVVIAERMGAKDTSRSGPNGERRRMAYGNDRRNAYDTTKAKLRYEALCHYYFVSLFVAASSWDLHYSQ